MDIAILRLANQQLSVSKFRSVNNLVAHLGAMQAQDYSMSKWAVGSRLPGSTVQDIEDAIDKGEILRTHVLRPTWHLVSSGDIRWMTELSATRIKAAQKTRNEQLGLNEQILKKCNLIIQDSLAGGNSLTREELIPILKKSGIATDENRASHIFFQAELEGLICSGKIKSNKTTYALLNDRVPYIESLSREESLKRLAIKYFSSHGPATLKDFAWWSGLSMKEASSSIEMVKQFFITEKTASGIYMLPVFLNDTIAQESVFLLAAFDEFLISYSDRTASTSPGHHKKAISDNGIFRPVIVINGRVAGIWKRTVKRENAIIDTYLFKHVNLRLKNSIEEKAEEFGIFSGKKIMVRHNGY